MKCERGQKKEEKIKVKEKHSTRGRTCLTRFTHAMAKAKQNAAQRAHEKQLKARIKQLERAIAATTRKMRHAERVRNKAWKEARASAS